MQLSFRLDSVAAIRHAMELALRIGQAEAAEYLPDETYEQKMARILDSSAGIVPLRNEGQMLTESPIISIDRMSSEIRATGPGMRLEIRAFDDAGKEITAGDAQPVGPVSVTEDEVQDALKRAVASLGVVGVRTMLVDTFGVTRLSEIPSERRAEFVARFPA